MKTYSERRTISKTGRVYYPRNKEEKKKANMSYYKKHGTAVKHRIAIGKIRRMESNPRQSTIEELNLSTQDVEKMWTDAKEQADGKEETLAEIDAYYTKIMTKVKKKMEKNDTENVTENHYQERIQRALATLGAGGINALTVLENKIVELNR